MYQIILIVLFFKPIYTQVCSNVSKFDCECRTLTDHRTHLPILLADCSSRGFNYVPESIERDLSVLDLSLNEIQILNPKVRAFTSHTLEELILSWNNITYIDVNFFENLPSLRKVDLSNNFIVTLVNPDGFQNLASLTYLDLSYNQLNTLPDFVFNPLYRLKHLDLSYNYLRDYLMQSKSVLVDKLSVTSNLTQLFLDGLNLEEIPNTYFDHFSDLKRLSLTDNGLQNIPIVPYSVEHLDLSGNKLTFISAKYLNYHSLRVLKLNSMESLTSIHHYAFYNLFALEKLYINDCPNLEEFNALAFDNPSKDVDHHPKFLSLSNNGLKTLNESYKYFFKKMSHIDLTHNPWNCDCGLIWLQNFEDELYRAHEIRCNSPADLKLKKIIDLKPEDLKDCFPGVYGKKSHRVLIVVLSVACVMLCGLIFYLLRYPINGLASKHRVGPNSPYNLAPTMEQN